MSPAEIAACAEQIRALLIAQEQNWQNTSDRHFGTIIHNLDQLRIFSERTAEGWRPAMEQALRATIRLPAGRDADVPAFREVNAVADLISVRVGRALLDELKTGGTTSSALRSQLDVEQMIDQMMVVLRPRSFGIFRDSMEAVWSLTDAHLSTQSREVLLQQMETVVGRLRSMGFDEGTIQQILGRFHFRFAEAAESGAEGALGPAMHIIFGADGKLALAASNAAGNSPNFGPAMEELFGANGKVAQAATRAAGEVNVNTAEQELEQKLEQGAERAFGRAGQEAADHAGSQLATHITAGMTNLGTVLTTIPQLRTSLIQLGDAWSHPLRTTEDYMNLMTNLGGVIQQAGVIFQAFGAIQAAVNAIAAMNPYVLIALAVIALIAGIVLLIVYWDRVKAAIRDNPWLQVIAVMFGVIGVIVLIIAYWDEIKLAALQAANFVSIQIQRVGLFFVGLKNLAGMVWGWIVATVENAGIGILNTFISIGVSIENFFIGIVNFILDKYNDLADSVVGDVLGLSHADLIPQVDVQTKLIPPKEVPQVSVQAAFAPMTGDVTGGLEGQIAAQQQVVDKAHQEDEQRRQREARERADRERQQQQGAPGAPGAPAPLPGAPALPALPGAPGAPAGLPGLPPGAVPGAPPAGGGGGGGVTVQGGITVNINAERLEANAAQMLSDEIVRALNDRLQALQGDANRRMGTAQQAA